jgi:hypothetical protein
MIAVDTNALVYAHREDSPHHLAALGALRSLAEAGRAGRCRHGALDRRPRLPYYPALTTRNPLVDRDA